MLKGWIYSAVTDGITKQYAEYKLKFTYDMLSVQAVISSYVLYKATACSKHTSITFIHDMCDTFNIHM